MLLYSIREGVVRETTSEQTSPIFQAARMRRPALAAFDGLESVIAFLNSRDENEADRRSEVTAALIAEAQTSGQSLWFAALLRAFFPVLAKLHRSISTGNDETDQERSLLVCESLIDAVAAFSLKTQARYAVANLTRNTRRLVMRTLATEGRRDAGECELEEDTELPDRETEDPVDALVERERSRFALSNSFHEWLADICDGAMLALIGTYASGKPLIDHVREMHPEAGPEKFQTLYEKYRRRRSRIIQRIRRKLKDGCPKADMRWLY